MRIDEYMQLVPYNIIGDVYIRSTALSFNIYEEYLKAEQGSFFIEKCIENYDLLGIISHSSPNFVDSIQKHGLSEEIVLSLLKYFIRSTTRSTPYGALAGFSKVEFGNDDYIVRESKLSTFARLDYESATKIAWRIASSDVSSLRVKWNNSLIKKTGRIYNENPILLSRNLVDSANHISNISKSEPLEIIEGFLKEFKPLSEVLEELKKHYDDMTENDLKAYLEQLIDENYLISSYLIPTDSVSPESYLISVAPEPNSQIQLIKSRIEAYNNSEGILSVKFNDILFEDCKYQFDASVKLKNGMKKEKFDLAPLAGSLALLSSQFHKYDPLKTFKRDFLERFGHSEIHILEALDVYNVSENEITNSDNDSSHNAFLANIIFSHDAGVIDLTKFHLPIEKIGVYPESIDLFLNISKNGKMKLSGYGVSSGAYRTVSRFAYLNNEIKKDVENFLHAQHTYWKEKNIELKEVYYINQNLRLNNVMLRSTVLSKIDVCANTDGQDILSLSVGIDSDDKVYIRDIVTGKRIMPTRMHVLSHSNSPGVVKLLTDIETQYNATHLPWDWGDFSQIEFLPRIEYLGITVSPKIWNPPIAMFEGTFQLWKEKFFIWTQSNYIGPKVYYGDLDTYLLLDLQNELCLKLLYKEFKNKRGKLIEYDQDQEERIVQDEQGCMYESEFIIPLRALKPQIKLGVVETLPLALQDISVNRPKLFSDCLYYILYLPKANEGELIKKLTEIFPATTSIWFFVRYSKNGNHIRIRVINLNINSNLLEMSNRIQNSLQQLMIEEIIDKYSIETYEREVNRYGGLDSIMKIERSVFFPESNFISSHLNEINAMDLYIMITDQLLDCMGVDMKNRIDYFNNFGQDRSSSQYNLLLASFLRDNRVKAWDNIAASYKYGMVYKALDVKDVFNEFTNRKSVDVFSSLIHMTANRLGIKPDLEQNLNKLLNSVYSGFLHYIPPQIIKAREEMKYSQESEIPC